MSDQIGSARQEAERLIAAAMAVAQMATRGLASPHQPAPDNGRPAGGTRDGDAAPGGARMATGDPECCICPVCRTIAALREPDPRLAERLVTGAGDFAVGLTSLLRSLSAVAGAQRAAGRQQRTGQRRGAGHSHGGQPSPDADSVWRAATRAGHDASAAAGPSVSAPGRDAWAQATATPVDDAGRPVSQTGPPPSAETKTTSHKSAPQAQTKTTSRKPMAKKATRPVADRAVAPPESATGPDAGTGPESATGSDPRTGPDARTGRPTRARPRGRRTSGGDDA